MEPALTPAAWPAPASARYRLLLALGSLALCAGWAAVVLGSASWAQMRGLDGLFPYFGWHIRVLTPAEWLRCQRGAGALAAALGLAWLLAGPLSRRGQAALRGLGGELAAVGQGAGRRWRALPRGQRWFFGAHLLVLTAVRLYLGLAQHWADDAVSYEFFVRQRLLAPAAYYPLPNNHVGSNVLDWAFYQLWPGHFWWAMRLPALLAATAGTVGMWAGLLRRLGYWPALLAAGLMSWAELSLFHAGAGRGYWLVADAAAVQLLAVLALQGEREGPRPLASPRVAWLVLVGAGLLGCYAVPVGVYALASAWSWLGLRALRGRQWKRLGGLAGLGLAAGAGTLLLYAPLLLVSRPAAIASNSYVRQLSAAEFWPALPRFAWLMEGQLLGQRYVGAVAALLALALLARLGARVRRGREPAWLGGAARQVGGPALWFLAFPYALLLVQRVLPPERTWLYQTWAWGIVAALGLAGWRVASWPRARRWLLGAVLGLYVAYQVANLLRLDHYAWQGRAGHRAAYAWLLAHPAARPALVPDLYTWAWFRFHAHIERPGQPFTAEQGRAVPGRAYGSVVVEGGQVPPPGTGPLWYQAGSVRVYHPAPPTR